MSLNNSGTAGPTWLSLFLLAPYWSGDGFRQKNPDPGSGFSENPEKPDPEFFGLKPPRDQDGANKKKFSKIGPAVPEELGNKQTDTHTDSLTGRLVLL